MGEIHHQPGQLSCYQCLRMEFQDARVTSDRGLVRIRARDGRLGWTGVIQKPLVESRTGRHPPCPLADLCWRSVDSRLAGDEDLHDATRLVTDPTVRLIGSEQVWAQGAARTAIRHGFETERREALRRNPVAGMTRREARWCRRTQRREPNRDMPASSLWTPGLGSLRTAGEASNRHDLAQASSQPCHGHSTGRQEEG
jgi:hypothetical protein